MSSSGMSRFPFTASQYQELEHQALIFKYIISGMQIPPELLFSMKRTSFLDSPFSSPGSKFQPHQPQHAGWNCFQMGLGKKIDLEPGRCRRTDGKKWRCSKEAYPDSKYCERHMHRGKNRSRKHVETTIPPTQQPITLSSSSSSSSNPATTALSSSETSNASLSISSMNKNPYSLNQSPAPSLYFASDAHPHGNAYPSAYLHHHGPHAFSYSSSRPPGIGLSPPRDNSTNFLMDTGSYSQDYRYLYGIKENVDEHAFFAEPSGTMKSMDDSWQLTPLTISSSSSSSKQSSGYSSYLQLHSQSKQEEMNHDDKNNNGGEHKARHQKTIHRFFDEGPPAKGRDLSWIDMDDKSSTTKLSISMPSSSYSEFSIFGSRRHFDD
ncbi:hypothetical protein MLD38_015090 [Melastoma candidum]|uniref:Uncharacterized protein n=1 Tax=Melastoma candidum TaxID=119954 RepID=A0ACB9REL8_9MYRT|nr:hypothetical protein MLD38_015090 [Melastoma candidum]